MAEPLWFEESDAVLGAPYFVMKKVTGRVGQIGDRDVANPGLPLSQPCRELPRKDIQVACTRGHKAAQTPILPAWFLISVTS